MTTGVHQEHSLLRTLARWAFHLAALAAVCAPLPLAFAALSGIGHRWVDILAQFTGPAVLPAVLLTFGFAIIRQRGWAIASAAMTALLLIAVWPQWFPDQGEPREGAPVVRVYSANLYYLNDDVAAIRSSLETADADIVILIELGEEATRQADAILEGYPHRVASLRLDVTRGPSRSVIASRYPLRALPDPPDGLHSVGAVADSPLGHLNLIGAHLTRPWPYQYQWGQISQTMALTDIRKTLAGPVIIAGDFNSVSSARIGRQVKSDMGLIPAPGVTGTWPTALPPILGITIDQVWRSPDLALLSRKLGQTNGSDHLPVVTEFTLAAE
ncbi:endonuclease/exonuclease/phosphatase family protein [Brevundimonas kwangchunensis]|uniref:Endonuclease/exonuclease/phosphatase family protein n=1 Tax=Brevundimonas kwangchunensis TaxID=322163 RepID=A0ABN1H6M7_9CAUL